MKNNWIYAQASAIGNSHITNNIPCQDYAMVRQEGDLLITIVCDGAGSAEMSHIGARETCKYAMYYLVNWFMGFTDVEKEAYNEEEIIQKYQRDWKQDAIDIAMTTIEDLEDFTTKSEIPLKSLACTFIAVVAYKNSLWVMHIGDGRAGYCDSKGDWKALMTPFRGEEANETVFITSDFWKDKEKVNFFVRTNVIQNPPENPIKAFCLMSDGCEKASFLCNLYDEEKEVFYDPNQPYPPFFNPNVEILKNLHAQNLSQEEINALWEKFLTAGNEKLKNESDDKTMILAVKP